MEQADTTGYLEPIPWNDALEAEWQKQMNGTASPALARERIPAAAPPKGRVLWLVVRRSLLMVIAAFDEAYGIETKKR